MVLRASFPRGPGRLEPRLARIAHRTREQDQRDACRNPAREACRARTPPLRRQAPTAHGGSQEPG